jgi:3-methyl-2-oxobutanoate hydroxymethyltransferase
VSRDLEIPTIGIGAGAQCDGQVQVIHDLLGLFDDFVPKHAKRYADLREAVDDAARRYVSDVVAGEFPTDQESFVMDEDVLRRVIEAAPTGSRA